MGSHPRGTRIRRSITWLVLAGLLGLSAILLTQCRMVEDTVTGVDLSAATGSDNSDCQRKCTRAYKQAKREEDRRYRKALKACEDRGGKKDDDDDDDDLVAGDSKEGGEKSCRQNERQIHKDILRKLKEDRKDCKNNCYDEGDGKAGR